MAGRCVFENLSLVTMAGDRPDATPLKDAVIAAENGAVTYAGSAADFDGDRSGAIDMAGALCLPGLVACHNPCLWVGDGGGSAGLTGEGYRTLTRRIAEQTRTADDETLASTLHERMDALSRSGVTACELKSGYGGDPDTELRLARVLAEEAQSMQMRTRVTLALGCVLSGSPTPDEALEHIERAILPATYEAGCAQAMEVFCDDEAGLDLDTCSTILELYYKKKIPSRVACDRFEDSAGATLPASFYSRCATFLNRTDSLDLESLANVGAIAIIVPETARTDADQTLPDIGAIRGAGGRFALAPHLGPDGGGKGTMLSALRAGRRLLGLSVEETICAGTLNAARALGIAEEAGVIATGRCADLAFFDAETPETLLEDDGAGCVAVVRSGELTRFDG